MIPFMVCYVLSFFEILLYVSAIGVFSTTKEWYKKHKWLFVTIATLFFVANAYILDERFYIKITVTVLLYIVIAHLIVEDKISVKLCEKSKEKMIKLKFIIEDDQISFLLKTLSWICL